MLVWLARPHPYDCPVPVRDNGNVPGVPSQPQELLSPSLQRVKNLWMLLLMEEAPSLLPSNKNVKTNKPPKKEYVCHRASRDLWHVFWNRKRKHIFPLAFSYHLHVLKLQILPPKQYILSRFLIEKKVSVPQKQSAANILPGKSILTTQNWDRVMLSSASRGQFKPWPQGKLTYPVNPE